MNSPNMDAGSTAFFDLDRTLIEANSAVLWAQHERRHNNISLKQFIRVGFWNALYHMSVIDIDRAYQKALDHYRGLPFEHLRQRTREWFFEDVTTRLRPLAKQAIAEHHGLGQRVVLLTSASCFLAEVAAEAWNFDAWLANEFHTNEKGELLGTFKRPLCYGSGKVERARAWAREHQVSIENSYFYSDSFTDLPMLETVEHPRIVSPDPRLEREARKRNWPILEW